LLLAFGPTDDAKGSGTCNAGHSASRLPFAAAFPPSPTRPQENARIPAAHVVAKPAAEQLVEFVRLDADSYAIKRSQAADVTMIHIGGELNMLSIR